MAAQIALPADLEMQALYKFDNLVDQGEILYEEATWKRVADGNVMMHFLISHALAKKPILPKDDPGRRQAKGPFVDPSPNFVLCPVGPNHTLIFNKFCVSRPMFLLHTNSFQPQTDDLNESDLTAAWTLLTSFKSRQIILYNCGPDAGASQGHKHLQMIPFPEAKDCVMFPDNLQLSYDEVKSDGKVPYENFVIGLESDISASQLLAKYMLLLLATRNALRKAGYHGSDYNVIVVSNWMAMIPRTHANYEGKGPTNGAGMMGMAWVKDETEVVVWEDIGIEKHLVHMGLPRSGKPRDL